MSELGQEDFINFLVAMRSKEVKNQMNPLILLGTILKNKKGRLGIRRK